MREFCEFRNILPHGVKLSAEDIWDRCAYVLSVKMQDPQFAGADQRASLLAPVRGLRSGVVKDAFQPVAESRTFRRRNAGRAGDLQRPAPSARRQESGAQEADQRAGVAGQAGGLHLAGSGHDRTVPGGRGLGGRIGRQARDREYQAIMPLRAKILNTQEVSSGRSARLAGSARHFRGDRHRSGQRRSQPAALRQNLHLADADSDGLHIATLLCALFVRHFRSLVKGGHVYVAMPPLYRIDLGKRCSTRWMKKRKPACWNS